MEYRLIQADGNVIWVRDSARIQSKGSSRIVYGVVSDVTERKRAEEELRATNQQLQELTDHLQEELILAQKIQQSLLPAGTAARRVRTPSAPNRSPSPTRAGRRTPRGPAPDSTLRSPRTI